jgi:serine/threonine protein phosphatase 1
MSQIPALLQNLFGKRATAARMPHDVCVYAVGDVHGRLDLLERLLDRIWADAEGVQNYLIMIGDYVDRGPDSKGVIEYLSNFDRLGWVLIPLRGNHDQFVLDFLDNPGVYAGWYSSGGAETLLSYGVSPPATMSPPDLELARNQLAAKLPERHREFLTGLLFHYSLGDYYFAHAGIRPTVSLSAQKADDLLWIRDEFLLAKQKFEKIVVHGHSPAPEPVRATNRICIDTGAYATGRLTAVKLWDVHHKFLSVGAGAETRRG